MKHTLLLTALLVFTITACQGNKPPQAEVAKSSLSISDTLIPISDSCPKEHYVYVSWNLANFGRSKGSEELEIMGQILRDVDIVAGQEVSVSEAGAQAVAKLDDVLNRKGAKWDYIISDRTEPKNPGVERYAFFWKTAKIRTNHDDGRLIASLQEVIDREPYSMKFTMGTRSVTAFSIHAVPIAKNPIHEVEALAKSVEFQRSGNMILSGDFNLAAKDTDPLLKPVGFTSYIHEETSLGNKVKPNGNYRSHQYDNVYTKGDIGVCTSGVIDFPARFFSPVTDEKLKEIKKVSDHLPVYIVFYFRN